jgi:myo-inositol-1-phosphate synthase
MIGLETTGREGSVESIRVAIAGVGNCASALVQSIEYYRQNPADDVGLLFPTIGGYRASDIVPVAAFDVDARKVGLDLSEAIHQQPNCTLRFHDVPALGVRVQMGTTLDGVPQHLAKLVSVSDQTSADIADVLRKSGAEILINLLPTGSFSAARAYAQAAIVEAEIGFINGIPELIVSDPGYAELAEKHSVPLIGDDFKSQLGTTILHQALIRTFIERGVKIDRMYQYNYAGNTDFLNLENRGETKEATKRGALEEILPYEVVWGFAPMYIKGMDDIKTGVIHIEGRNCGGNSVEVDLTLKLDDSANAAGVMIDMIRFAKVAKDRGMTGVLRPVCAYYAKHPPVSMPVAEAKRDLDALAGLTSTPATA